MTDWGYGYTCTSKKGPVLSAWPWVSSRSGDPAAGDRGGYALAVVRLPLLVPQVEPVNLLPVGGWVLLQPHRGVIGLADF